jgi:hypothetical protein
MNKIARIAMMCLTPAIMLAAAQIAHAQKTADMPSAPVPAQILTAKKIFIANGDSDPVLGVPNLAYNEFYASIKNSNRYELVQAPADADLVFEILSEIRFPAAVEYLLHLTIVDPKTSVVLWRITEHVQTWAREATGRKNFSTAMSALVDDLKTLSTPPPAAAGVPAPN